jgi:glycosyltransferase involved in cell wall biosynthesis
MPKVSIVVPVYNVEKYIDKCLNSLVNQTLMDIQIVVVDDGSTDSSAEIINIYEKKYLEKILYIRKKNGGLSDARNTGIQYASGEYIGCVDGDDYVEPTMYEKMYNIAVEEDADLVECDFFWEYPKKIEKDVGQIYAKKDMLIKARVIAWNKIIKKDLIKKYDIRYPVGLRYEDVEFFYKLVPHINRIGFLKEPCYHYVQRKNSILHYYNEQTSDIFKILENVLMYYQKEEIFEKYYVQLEYIYIRYLLGSSFLRIVKIDNVKTREKILKENWDNLNVKFPNWKKNKMLKEIKILKNIYFRTINNMTYKIYCKMFGILFHNRLFLKRLSE